MRLWMGVSQKVLNGGMRLAHHWQVRGLAEKVLSRQNVLLEGMTKKDQKGGGIANLGSSMEKTMVSKQRNSEAAFFRLEDDDKIRVMSGKDPKPSTSTSTAAPTYEPAAPYLTAEEEVRKARAENWRRMIDAEFTEFDGDEIPKSLKVRVADIKEKIFVLLGHTAFSDKKLVDQVMIDKIRDVDTRMIRTAKRIELGLETEEEAREAEEALREEVRAAKENRPLNVADLSKLVGIISAFGATYFTYLVVSDEKHRMRARQVAPTYLSLLESVGAVPADSGKSASPR